ncbi:discoidin domain-containing protein [Psychromonas ossibalaenae]|uniref:discoidin domain-containing protein n=1 Tax=Psychromonas ossibalaenae TaxID=444922 RepID=UPI000361FCBB|nr:discoidin domain-containing protein [Psychromonas ossibalaenae]
MNQKMFKKLILASAIQACLLGAAYAAPLTNLDIVSLSVEDNQVSMQTEDAVPVRVSFISDSTFRIQAGNFQDEKVDALEDQCDLLNCNDPDFDIDELPSIVINEDQGDVPFTSENQGDYHLLATDEIALRIYHSPLTFALYKADNSTLIWQELSPLDIGATVTSFDQTELRMQDGDYKTVQILSSHENEHFYGGGQQNGEFEFNGKILKASYSGGWEEFDRPSPSPLYFSDSGYGVLRNTWRNGGHDFRAIDNVTASYNENRFDAYYFTADDIPGLVDQYTKLTGRPHLMARWAYYLGDADCYENKNGVYPPGWPTEPGVTSDVIDQVGVPYKDHNMPVGWILPNDGYGCGYSELPEVVNELDDLGIKTGLWTERDLTEIETEVSAGVQVYKLDVAWTGPGKLYSLDANNKAHEGLTDFSETRGMVWTVMGWAGTQRYSVTWTGDQATNWDYIRWHIPTYIGSGLSGQAYPSSDVNGIFGSGSEIYTRDVQFKAFSPVLIAMSGWDSGERKHPWWFEGGQQGLNYRDINRQYLMLKSALMPYTYNFAYEAERTGAPIVRAMMWDHPDIPVLQDETYKYQYMYGDQLLVAPVFESMLDNRGWRPDIYIPEGQWIDYWDGIRTDSPEGGALLEQYPVTLNKIPVLVKAGAIIPMYEASRSDDLQDKNHLMLDLYPSGESEFILYEDDGESRAYQEDNAYAETLITMSAPEINAGNISVSVEPTVIHNTYEDQIEQRNYTLMVHSLIAPDAVDVNDSSLTEYENKSDFESANTGWFYDETDRLGIIWVKTDSQSVSSELDVNIAIPNQPLPETPNYPIPSYSTDFDKNNIEYVVTPDSDPNYPFSNAWDGADNTIWRSAASTRKQAPTSFVIGLGDNFITSGFYYHPDQTDIQGMITEYKVYLSNTNGDWGAPVASGEWLADTESKLVNFAGQNASYLKVEILSSHGEYASASQFDVVATKEPQEMKTIYLELEEGEVEGNAEQDVAVTGSAMSMNGLAFDKGLGVDAPSNITYRTDGTWTNFQADVGIDDSCKDDGIDNSVMASVYLDNVKAWEYDISGPTVVKPNIDLFGKRIVELKVENNDGNLDGNCINWANARFDGPENATFNDFDKSAITFLVEPAAQPGQEIQNAWSGDPNQIYHSPWSPVDDTEKAPQTFVIDLGGEFEVETFTYQARAGAGNGTIGDYKLSLSNDSEIWSEVAAGSFEVHDQVQRVDIDPFEAKYLKFEALTGSGDFVSAAEFDVFAKFAGDEDEPVDPEPPVDPSEPEKSGGSTGILFAFALAAVALSRRLKISRR